MQSHEAWLLDDHEALVDTIEMGSMLSAYLDRWGARGYDEVAAIAIAAGRAAGYVIDREPAPDAEGCECDETEP
ncbi:hypothetical protein [Agromyces salentinus]|uniref:Uncharacterized protein n=1 Tax=Agromyces salentinus TaxID=269421 RepID=A0ABN2MRQ1_9MICO|nr:hypothetical protein [Agromyces salentinus]